MSFDAEVLFAELGRLEAQAGTPSRYVVAFSGGLDSTVLLHAMTRLRDRLGRGVLAIHVDHGLRPESPDWGRHCARVADSWGVECRTIAVSVDLDAGRGPEAAARDARYAVLAPLIETGDWLLSAHHEDDQAETLVLNLLRGSGPMGIAGIRAIRPFFAGWLGRPLLGVSRAALAGYAQKHVLEWLDDPSNESSAFDRNFLRNEVLPVIAGRWPDAGARLARSASLAREAATLLDESADGEIARMSEQPGQLPVDRLLALSVPVRRNLLRRALRRLSLPVAGHASLSEIAGPLLEARDDAQPCVGWPGAEARRYRNTLYLLATLPGHEARCSRWAGDGRLDLGPGLGSLELVAAESGLPTDVVAAGLEVRSRRGGEEIRPEGHTHTRKLKKLLQEQGVLPWMRERLPLVFAGERLVAVGDLWHAADAVSPGGRRVVWRGRPALD